MATDVSPIGRISFQQADPLAQATAEQDTTPGSQAATTALPTLNPDDSPYKPLNLPQQQTPQEAPMQEQQPPANLGAVGHAGAAAYLIDNILKGASHGYAQGQAFAADQYNKKLSAFQSLYNSQAQQVYEMAKSGQAGTYSGPPGPDGKPTFVPTSEFDKARQQMLASWQAMMQTVGQRIPQQKKGKKSSAQDDQTSQLQQALDHKGDPNAALAATYQLGLKFGPPVAHQVAGFLTPQYIAQQQQRSQTAGTTAEAQQTQAHVGLTTAQMQDELQTLRAKPQKTEAENQRVDQLTEALSPTPKPTAGAFKQYKRPDGTLGWYDVSRPETIPQGSTAVQVGAIPRSVKYDAATDQLIDPEGNRWGANDPNLPQGYSQIFEGAHKVQAEKQASKSSTTTATHTVMVSQGGETVPVQVETITTHQAGGGPSAISHPTTGTTARPSPTPRPASNAGVVSMGQSVGWKETPEQKKANTDAIAAMTNYRDAVAWAKSGSPTDVQSLFMGYSRAQVQGAGRLNDAEIKRNLAAGTYGTRLKNAWDKATQGTLDPEFINNMVNTIHTDAVSKQQTAESLGRRNAPAPATTAVLPDAAKAQLKEGHITTFGNGQKWTIENGQPKQVQ